MTDSEKLSLFRTMLGKDAEHATATELTSYLLIASNKILNRLYPYDDTKTIIPAKYDYLQCEIAVYLWNKRGAEGQMSHNENGISRSYESASVPPSMLSDVVPHCGIFGGHDEMS